LPQRHSSTRIARAFIDARVTRAHARTDREMIAFGAPSTRGAPASRGRASEARVRRAAVLRPRAAAAPSSATRGDGTRAAAVTREQCVEFIRSGCKPKSAFRCVRDDARSDARKTRTAAAAILMTLPFFAEARAFNARRASSTTRRCAR
jgi:hypothetical protein